MNSKQRDRGRILTPGGLSRLQQAIRAWELKHEVRCTQERIKELTSAVKEGGLDPGTIRKILKAKDGVDPESIRCLFTTFGLQLVEADLVSSSRLQIQADPNFVGREGAIADLNALVNRGVKVIVIQARGGVGKTTLARKYLQQEFGSLLEFPIAKETKDIASIESLIEEKLRQLGEEPGREFFVSLDRLKRKLQNERIGILIDNLEPALDSAGKFIELHRRYVELLRVLTDPAVQSVTFITSRERLRESSVTVEHYMLKSLDIEAWEQFFHSRNLATDTSAFTALHNAYGGNAKAMDIIRGAILEDYSGDVAAYWQANQYDLFIERDLEDLVTQQFGRLQQIDADAYNLLCRMGCYRYQDVPTVPIEGLLCLLWDVPENRQRRVVKSLQDRSLIDVEGEEYWLHPVIRGEAIGRLRKSKDWEATSHCAAKFWLNNVESIKTTKDALEAFEAYYHYLEIYDLEGASDVILNGKPNKWQRDLALGASLYRMGLYQQLLSAIPKVINDSSLKSKPLKLSGLYHNLSNVYWGIGHIHTALDYQKIARTELEKYLNSNHREELFVEVKRRQVLSLFNTGLYKMDLWELEESGNFFSQVIKFSEEIDSYRRIIKASSFLAFIKASLGHEQEAFSLAEQAYDGIFSVEYGEIGGFSFYLWAIGKAYKTIGEIQRAVEVYQRAFSDVADSGYVQGRAKVLNGIAEINREQADFGLAFLQHSEAIELLEKIGAKCDLAEAYYQLGLTHQAMSEVEKSNENFNEAIWLFNEMEAPKQVEKVRQAIARLGMSD